MDDARERKALISGWGHEFCRLGWSFLVLGFALGGGLWRSSYKMGWGLGLMSGI